MLLAATPLAGQTPSPFAVVLSGGERAQASVQLHGLSRDRALREALASGLPLRFRFRIELWRKDPVFDQLAGSHEALWSMVQNPLEGGFTLRSARGQSRAESLDGAERALEAAFAPPLQPRSGGRFYYLATLDVETLSLSDLEELERWLRGEAGPAVQGQVSVGRALQRGLRRVFVRVIGLPTRRWEARTPTFTVR